MAKVMQNAIKDRKCLRVSAAMLALYVACALSWWWGRGGIVRPGRLFSWLDYFSLILVVPGWVLVTMFDPRENQLATRLTDALIPILSAISWTLLALPFWKLSRIVGGYIQRRDKSR